MNKWMQYLLDGALCRRDIQAMQALASLSPRFTPWSAAALRPSGMVTLLNEMVIYDRWQVVELGGGVSTLLFARLLSERGRGHLITVEHDDLWARQLSTFLDDEGLVKHVTIVHAPLAPCSSGYSEESSWYNEDLVREAVDNFPIELLVVDGPPAYSRATEHSRYPAVPILYSSMSTEGFAIVLDDIWRQGERRVLSRWEREYELRFDRRYLNGSLALVRTDSSYAV
jgi:hypothetical protein